MQAIKISDIPNGYSIMETEARLVMSLIEESKDAMRSLYPQHQMKVYPNEYFDEGINMEINGHTLICQSSFLVQKSPTFSFLTLSIYDVIFNERGVSINKDGLPELHQLPDNLLKNERYVLMLDQNKKPLWTEEENSTNFYTSEELVIKWITDYISILK